MGNPWIINGFILAFIALVFAVIGFVYYMDGDLKKTNVSKLVERDVSENIRKLGDGGKAICSLIDQAKQGNESFLTKSDGSEYEEYEQLLIDTGATILDTEAILKDKTCVICGRVLEGQRRIHIELGDRYYCHYNDARCFRNLILVDDIMKRIEPLSNGVSKQTDGITHLAKEKK